MKIKLNDDSVGYFSVRKREADSQFIFRDRFRTLPDQQSLIKEETLEAKPTSKSPKKLHPLQVPSERYFKRVFNKDISPKKPIVIPSTSRTSVQRKDIDRTSKKCRQQNINHAKSQMKIIEQKQNESSTYNFSIGLLNRSNAFNSSFVKQNDPPVRNSTQRKLDFTKIFIETQEQSYRSVIQLSLRQLENKQMLDKAVQELDKRKFQKKIKILKKNMGMDPPKSRKKVDQAIEMLRNQSIGYKTFYRNQISTARCQTQTQENSSLLNTSRYMFRTPRIALNTIQSTASQQDQAFHPINPQNVIQQSVTKNKIIIEDQDHKASKVNNQEQNDTSSEQPNQEIQDEFRKTDQNFKIKIDSKETQMHNSGTNDIKLPSLTGRKRQQNHKDDQIQQIASQNLKASRKPVLKSSVASLQRLSTIIKSTQNETLSMNRNRTHTKILESLQDPFDPKQLQENPALKQVQSPSDEFPFLMTKQDLQTTLNKSRYQMKKLLCLHIQKRQKQWKEVKRKMLLQEDNLETIHEEKHKKNKSKLKVNVLPPEHLLKIPTKQLKKSVRSFVSLLHTSRNLSPQQKDKISSKIK